VPVATRRRQSATRRLTPMTTPDHDDRSGAAEATLDPSARLTPPPDITTLGRLRHAGWTSIPVAEEIRRNAAARVAAGQPLVSGILGFDDSVLPQLENALLARHDVILLGERGQAKTRIIRSLVGLLDEWLPIVAHSEINDDPFHPVSRFAKDLVAEAGDDLPVSWVHRSERYGEKLATPDTSIADLIGEVDPIRVAEGRYLSDELTIHYGLVPRLNRGIFAVNELPDLAERIQVGLLNVLEERDVQIRGHRVRLPLDIVLVATANPEDYTNRGRIITPLKDRFGAQVRTHYPPDAATELRIAELEATLPGRDGGSAEVRDVGPKVEVPDFMAEIVAELSQLARESPHLNQRSGVSVRLTIANYETLVANATRRALRNGESEAVPRISDLSALVSSTQGKVEIESLEEGREDIILVQMVNAAVLLVFRRRVVLADPQAVVGAFDAETVVHAGDDLPASAYADTLAELPALSAPVLALTGGSEDPGVVASAVEFVLEGLHLTKRLNKEAAGSRALYRGRG
jgi:magnesium chelatase subunit I